MFSLRRAVFRNIAPGGLYVPPPVLQQNRMRAIRTVASLVPAASPRGNGAAAQPFYRSDIMVRQEQQRTFATTHQRYSQQDMMQQRNESGASGAPEPEPSNQLFVANISYGIRAEDLEREFSEFGKVVNSKIIYDPRGLSKGYGYVTYEDIDDAAKAVKELNGVVVDGRKVVVQFTLNKQAQQSSSEPSRTLFIGNLSFDITDKDLNEMFASIKNCLDVRVAIDRQTGLPRGFAHADFVDIPSAQKAKEFLEARQWSGRQLRIDYSGGRKSPQSGGSSDRTWMK